jgi:single-strand DNA-binding protein
LFLRTGALAIRAQVKGRKKDLQKMNFNQVIIAGFIGRAPEQKTLNSGKPVLKFSVATNKFWTDANNERKENTQWHQVVAYGDGFSKLAARLASGSHVLVQGEIVTREYERVIKVPNGKKTIEHKIQQQVVEIKANIIRVLDRSSNGSDTAETETEESGAEPQ